MRANGAAPAIIRGLLIGGLAAAHASTADAQDGNDADGIEDITVVGTRSGERAAADLAVPVDVVDSDELLRQGASRMDSMLTRAVPSLNVMEEPISDDATFVRPVTLRGLPPDSTLVLLNGKRRQRSSVIPRFPVGGTAGSHGTDVSSIPAIALERVEILLDGAAAQYGSDAVGRHRRLRHAGRCERRSRRNAFRPVLRGRRGQRHGGGQRRPPPDGPRVP